MRIRHLKPSLLIGAGGILLALFVHTQLSEASLYGRGVYGQCEYGVSCTISIASQGTVTLNATPDASSVYTIASDTVEVTTNEPDGYSLSLNVDSASVNALESVNDDINASSGTPSSPITLDLNTWGFRIDDFDDFGSGPTSAITSQPSSSLTFAGVPLSGSPVTIKTTNSSAPSGDETDIWYGIRVDMSIEAGTYTNTVTYTAVTL